MPQVCGVCSHAKREEIDADLVERRGSMSGIARKHGLSGDSVSRHAKSHLPKTLSVAAASRKEAHAGTLLERVRSAEEHARRLAVRAEEEGDIRAAVAGIRVLLDALELLGKVAAERESSAVSTHPKVLALQRLMFEAIEPWPEAVANLRATIEHVGNDPERFAPPIIVELQIPGAEPRRVFPPAFAEKA